jgi:hypothetical protein
MIATNHLRTLVCALVLSSSALAQGLAPDATAIFPLAPRPDGSLGVQHERLGLLVGLDDVVLIENQVPGAPDLVFELERVRLPGQRGTLLVDGRPAGTIAEACSPDLTVWKGRIAEQPASDVFLAFSSAGTWGWARLEDGRTVHLVCGSHPEFGWEQAQAQWVEDAAMQRPGFERRFDCATDTTSLQGLSPSSGSNPAVDRERGGPGGDGGAGAAGMPQPGEGGSGAGCAGRAVGEGSGSGCNGRAAGEGSGSGCGDRALGEGGGGGGTLPTGEGGNGGGSSGRGVLGEGGSGAGCGDRALNRAGEGSGSTCGGRAPGEGGSGGVCGDRALGGGDSGSGCGGGAPGEGGSGSGCGSGALGGDGGAGFAPLRLPVLQQTLYTAEAVIETDHAYYQEFNNTTAATNYANALLAACSDRFEAQVGCLWEMAYFALHTTSAADPYLGTNPDALLDEIQDRWDGSTGLHLQGDFGLVLSGHNGGGKAYISTLCSNFTAVGACCSIEGNTPFPVTGTSNLNWDFVVTTHEAGHIFASPHTHDFCPPLDQCATNPSCNPSVVCSLGTIMSYCHTCSFAGVKNISPYFHQTCANVMRSKVVSVGCLSQFVPPPTGPVITGVSPSSVPALTPDAWPTVTITGQNLMSVDTVLVDGVPLSGFPPEYTLVSDTQLNILWSPKSKLGPVQVRIGNAGGVANTVVNVVENTATVLDMVPSNPSFWVQGVGTKIYMAGPAQNLVYLAASTSGLPTVVPGLFALDLGNNLTNYVDLGIWVIDPVKGYSLLQTPVGGTHFATGTKVYVQAVILDTLNPVLPFPSTNLQQVTVLF